MLNFTNFLFENRKNCENKRSILQIFFSKTGKVKKGYVQQTICHEGTEGEYRYSRTLSSSPVLDGGGWLGPRPGCFISGEEDGVPVL